MAKKEEVKDLTKPVEVRAQTDEEVRKRLRSQGRLPKDDKKEEGGIHEVTDEEALVRMSERNERKETESKTENKLVRLLTDKDVALRLAASKKREDEKDSAGETGKFLTEEDIKARNSGDDNEEPGEVVKTIGEENPGNTEPVEIYAKDVVTFKDDDGKTITGKVKRVTSKGEAILDIEEGDDEYTYTVPCDILTKVEKEEK